MRTHQWRCVGRWCWGICGPSLTLILPNSALIIIGRFYFDTGGGDFCSSARGGSTQIQKRVKLEQCNSSKLSLFIKKLVLTNQDCVICTVNTQNLHCKSVVD